MIIENPDAFKSWLTSILEPLCDADPAALAKYVYALVKKDKPLGELREGMIDQLDVFLQHETKPFVDMLFKALETQEYLEGAEQLEPPPLPPPPPTEEPEPPVEEDKAPPPPPPPPTNGTTDTSPVSGSRSPSMGAAPRHRVVLTRTAKHAAPAPPPPPPPPPCLSSHRPHMEQTLVKAALPLTELLEEPVDQPPRRRDRRNDVFRDKEERRRRRSRSWERRGGGGGGGGGGGAGGGVPPRRRAHRDIDHERRHDKRRPMSRSPSPRRYRNRSPPSGLDKNSRSRSRSPIGGRDRDRDRDRLRVERDHRERVSRDRERSRERSRDRSRDRSMSPRPDSRIEHNDRYKRRCRDFDEKGYCMRGDLCQWDHGADPVVLEDAALSRLLPPPPPGIPAEYNPLAPDIWMAAGGPAPGPYGPMPTLPPRALVPIPRVRHEVPPPLPMGPGGPPLMPLPPRHQAPPKKQFDYNRLGGRGVMTGGPGCSLEVRKVPRGMNDITHLNNHFSKFGKIVNIQVCYENDPEGALITFASPVEANVAYKSTEAVLNNRFIKLFWHNPENKQENVAPPAGGPNNKQNNNSAGAHHNSHNKVLINKDNIKASADIRKAEKQTALEANPTTNSTEKPAPIAPASGTTNPTTTTNTTTNNSTSTGGRKVLVLEMHKRAQALLETQLQQQTLLIQRLESGNVTGPQKAALLEAISSAQEGIEKLRKELVAYNNAIRQMQEERMARALSKLQLQAKRPKTREEAQKEILDAELDMFTKQQEGQDVTELAKKIAELRRQMAVQFPHPASRRPLSRGGRINPAMRLTRVGGASTNKFNNQVVDHRPKALRVSGFEPDDLPQLDTHFAQFGEITGKEVDLAVPELVVAFKTRAAAEQAAARTRHYNDRTLSITWVTSNKPVGGSSVPASNSSTTPTSNGPTVTNSEPETPKEGSEDALLRFEEEEEEEREDRSWRR